MNKPYISIVACWRNLNYGGNFIKWLKQFFECNVELCRKIAMAKENGEIEIWGDGQQTRSFLFIDDCLDATTKLIRSDKTGPYNIGSEEMISINDFARLIMDVAGKKVSIKNIPGPVGVRGRCSDNFLIKRDLGWEPKYNLNDGINNTYRWIEQQVK